MNDERTFTVCGMADFLAPEIIQGQGHGLASDWCSTLLITFIIPVNTKSTLDIPTSVLFLEVNHTEAFFAMVLLCDLDMVLSYRWFRSMG